MDAVKDRTRGTGAAHHDRHEDHQAGDEETEIYHCHEQRGRPHHQVVGVNVVVGQGQEDDSRQRGPELEHLEESRERSNVINVPGHDSKRNSLQEGRRWERVSARIFFFCDVSRAL